MDNSRFSTFLQTIYRYCALVKLLRSLNGRLRAGPIASRRIVFPLNFRHFFPFVVVADVVDGSASGILVFVRIPADENSQQRLQNAPRYLPNKIEVGHDKSTHTNCLFMAHWHMAWQSMLRTTWMFVILHDIGRLHATRLKDNNETAAAACCCCRCRAHTCRLIAVDKCQYVLQRVNYLLIPIMTRISCTFSSLFCVHFRISVFHNIFTLYK